MKKVLSFLPAFAILLLGFLNPLHANHLDGLWHNDLLRITLRIEQDQDGFRAKRTDEGIWYSYTTQDNRYFTDRNGNWYDVIDDEEIVWNEAKTDKRIKFIRLENRDYNSRDNTYDPFDQLDNESPQGRYYKYNQHNTDDRNYQLEGTWSPRNGREYIQIIPSREGIRVKTDHHGWEKYYGDRTGSRYRSNNGNTIMLLDDDHIRIRSQYGKYEEIYTRHRSWNRDRNYWRD